MNLAQIAHLAKFQVVATEKSVVRGQWSLIRKDAKYAEGRFLPNKKFNSLRSLLYLFLRVLRLLRGQAVFTTKSTKDTKRNQVKKTS